MRLRRHLEGRRGWRADATALGLGAAAVLAMPPVHLLPILLVCLPGLLWLADAQPGWRGAARIGFWWGFGHFLAGLYWVTEAILVDAATWWWLVPIAAPLLALGLAPFVALPVALARLLPGGWRRTVGFAALWTLSEMLRGVVLTGFPWNPMGSVWSFHALPLQPAAWVGVFGLSLATVLIAVVWPLGPRWAAGAAAGLALWLGAGFLRLDTPAETGVTLVIVQPAVDQAEKAQPGLALDHFRRLLALTQQGLREAGTGPRAVIWPETASPYPLELDPDAREAVAVVAQGVPVLAGTVRFTPDRRPLNSLAAILRPDGIGPAYDKHHLVPFGEYQPDWFPLPIQIVPGGGFAAGSGPATLRVPGLPPFSPIICYEAIFPGRIVPAGDRPDWIVNVTNDGWFGNSSGPRQHLAAARLRAVEEGLPLARAANTGISAVFDAQGREVARLELNFRGVLIAPLPAAGPPTPFSVWRRAIPLGLALLVLAAAIAVPRRASASSPRGTL